jgi:hypothetical protein
MTCAEVPGEILFDRQPPKPVTDGALSGVKSSMSERVVGFVENMKAIFPEYNKLLAAC